MASERDYSSGLSDFSSSGYESSYSFPNSTETGAAAVVATKTRGAGEKSAPVRGAGVTKDHDGPSKTDEEDSVPATAKGVELSHNAPAKNIALMEKEMRHEAAFHKKVEQFMIFTVLTNILLALLGVAGVVFGAYLLGSDFSVGYNLTNIPIPEALVVLGGLIMLFAAMALFGGYLRHLDVYAWSVVFMAALFVAVATITAVCQWANNGLTARLALSWYTTQDSIRNALQTQFQCCGFYTVIDHIGSNCGTKAPSGVVMPGCGPALMSTINDRIGYFGTAGLVASAALLFAVLVNLVLRVELGSPLAQKSSQRSLERSAVFVALHGLPGMSAPTKNMA